jgi:abequosyltransferase
MRKKVLTLCFPTYNRDWCIKEQIQRLRQCPIDTLNDIEIIISDNCSTDDTEKFVQEAISDGFNCVYVKNEVNLGMDGNFVQCFKLAKGDYIWLLGDDDYIIIESLPALVSLLALGQYGLVHLNQREQKTTLKNDIEKYKDDNKFIRDISYWVTFISANIVNTKYIDQIDFKKYMGTWFTIMPLYITALHFEQTNLMIKRPIFEKPKDAVRNGGYNYFKVFVKNYLTIWEEFSDKNIISKSTFLFLKKDIFKKPVNSYIYYLLVRHNQKSLSSDGAWKILFHYYGKHPYFYMFPIRIVYYIFRSFTNYLKRNLNIKLSNIIL